MDGLEEDKGLNEFFRRWSDIGYSPLGICQDCQTSGPVHTYKNKETQETKNLCIECIWYYVELMAEYLKMEEVL